MPIINYDALLSKKLLEEAVKKAWNDEVLKNYCAVLVVSIPRRLAACTDAKGRHTKYLVLKKWCEKKKAFYNENWALYGMTNFVLKWTILILSYKKFFWKIERTLGALKLTQQT